MKNSQVQETELYNNKMNRLENQNRRLNKILQHLDSLLFLVNSDYKVVYTNIPEKHTEFLPFEDDIGNIIGCTYSESLKDGCGSGVQCLNCEVRKAIVDKFNEDANLTDVTQKFCSIQLRDSMMKDVKISLSRYEENGENFLLVKLKENSELAKTKQKLDKKNNQFKTFIEHSPDIYYKYSLRQGRIYCSGQVERILGYTRSEFNQNPFLWSSLIHPEDYPRVSSFILNETNGAGFEINYRIKTKAGSWVWFNDYTLSKKISGDDILIEGRASDITLEKLTTLKLAENEKKLKTILQTIPDLIFHIDKSGRFVNFYQNSTSVPLLYHPNEFLNRTVADVFGPEMAERVERKFKKAFETGFSSLEYQLGENEYYEAKFAKLNDSEVIASIRDMSKYKLAEQKLEEAIATKDKFFNILAHDLRGPFNAIIGFSGILMRKHSIINDAKRLKLIEPIYSSATETYKLLENILDWARSQTGTISFQPEQHNLLTIFDGTIQQNRSVANEKNIEIISYIDDSLYVYVDIYMMQTVLRNFISNAIKFTASGGRIFVEAHADKKKVIVSVSDTGVGMSVEQQKKLFSLDEKLTTRGTNNEKGTGLGLILSKEFINNHDGQIWLESKEGIGTTFSFSLPACDSDAAE